MLNLFAFLTYFMFGSTWDEGQTLRIQINVLRRQIQKLIKYHKGSLCKNKLDTNSARLKGERPLRQRGLGTLGTLVELEGEGVWLLTAFASVELGLRSRTGPRPRSSGDLGKQRECSSLVVQEDHLKPGEVFYWLASHNQVSNRRQLQLKNMHN